MGVAKTTGDQPRVANEQELSLEERVKALETEVVAMKRSINRRNWAIEALLLAILLMGATAWILWRG